MDNKNNTGNKNNKPTKESKTKKFLNIFKKKRYLEVDLGERLLDNSNAIYKE